MRTPVGVIGVLIGIEIKIGMALGKLARNLDRAIGAFGRIGVDDIRAISL